MRETTDGPCATALWHHPLVLRIMIAGGTSLILAIIGPFGTFTALDLGPRLLYWTAAVGTGYALFEGLLTLAAAFAPRRLLPATLAGALLLAAALQTGVVIWLEQEIAGRPPAAAGGVLHLYLYVLILGVVIAALPVWLRFRAAKTTALRASPEQHTLRDRPTERPSATALTPEVPPETRAGPVTASSMTPSPAPAFFRRIPARLAGSTLLALEMEDHYLRLHTSTGSDLILMRMRDAVEELAGVDGLLVHRSFWVAAQAVTRFERDANGKITLVLCNGLRVPVSRARNGDLRTAGWLD